MAQKIYTKTGDKGMTSLFGGKKLPKSHLRIESYGTVDELNAHIGFVHDHLTNDHQKNFLKTVQDSLFTLGSQLACEPGKDLGLPNISSEDITVLEKEIDAMEATLPALKNFILPGGHPTVSACHIARCVCRRAERCVVALGLEDEVDSNFIVFLNRLSDYLFVLSRKIGQDLGAEEVVWKPRKS